MTVKNLFLGFDGADRAFIDAMIADGELPAFKRLRDISAVHHIENDPAMGAAQFWNSASIGEGPGHHGHHFYMQFKPDTYDVVPNHDSSLPDITPFWNTLDAEGYAIAVVDWHRMMAKPLVNGVIADNWLGHDPLTPTIWFPQSLENDAARFFKGDAIGGGFGSAPRDTIEKLQEYMDCIFNRIAVKTQFCIEQMASQDWDLFISCFSDAHDVGHYFYHLEDENHELYDKKTAAQIKKPLSDCYRRIDKAVGELIDAAGPDARVFTYGGPGMELFVSANGAMEEMMRRIDVGVEAPLSAPEKAKKTYHALIPKKFRWALAPLARVVRRHVAKSDFASRRFFAVPHNDNSGAVRINVKGRERYGIINRGQEYDAVVREITEGVSSFVNPETGQPIVKRVVCVPYGFDGPNLDVLPDLFIEWDRTNTPRTPRKIVSEKFGEIDIAPESRTGDHSPTGFFWSTASSATGEISRPKDITAPVVKAVRGGA